MWCVLCGPSVNAGEAWAAQRALEEVDQLEIEAAVLASEANEDILLAVPLPPLRLGGGQVA